MWADAPLAVGDRFSLDAHIGDTRGHPRILRLLCVANSSPELCKAAASSAAETARSETLDVNTYSSAVALANQDADSQWIHDTEHKVHKERDQLNAELRMYQNNMITESVRMAHRDLGDHFVRCGEFNEALLHFDKVREFSSTPEHALEANLRAMYAAYCNRLWNAALAYADKASVSLRSVPQTVLPSHTEDWRAVLADGDQAPTRAPPLSGMSLDPLYRGDLRSDGADAHASINSRIAAVRTLSMWARCNAMESLPEVDAGDDLGFADIVPPAMLAWYAVLGALSDPGKGASGRSRQLSEDSMFKRLSESDAGPRDVLSAFIATDMHKTLELLKQRYATLRLDPVIGARAPQMLECIVYRVLARYLSAYRCITIQRLAAVFGWSNEAMSAKLFELAMSGRLDVQIDWPRQQVTVCGARERDAVRTVLRQGEQATQVRNRLNFALKMEAAGHIVGN